MPSLPRGVWFNPSPENLVSYYLPRWIRGEPLDTRGYIHESDAYGCDPDTLTGQYPCANHVGHWFFFSRYKLKGDSGRRMARAAGSGTWVTQQSKKPVTQRVGEAELHIGHHQSLRFKNSGGWTGWLMEEYHCNIPEASGGAEGYMICKIYWSPRARPRQEAVPLLPITHSEPVASQVLKRPETPGLPALPLPSPKRLRPSVAPNPALPAPTQLNSMQCSPAPPCMMETAHAPSVCPDDEDFAAFLNRTLTVDTATQEDSDDEEFLRLVTAHTRKLGVSML